MRGGKSTKIAGFRVDSQNLNVESNEDSASNAESRVKSVIASERSERGNPKSQNLNAESWINALKIALVNKNEAQAIKLVENLPSFEKVDEMTCARELIAQVSEWFLAEKKTLGEKMEKVKTQRQFLRF
ncbi:hypothetical protein [Helicobacter sp. 23-1045]